LTFSTADFSIVENDGKHMIDYPASFNAICNTCDPILPSCVKNILLPPSKKVSNYTVTYTTTNWLNNINLEAMQMAYPTDGGNYIDEPCTYSLKIYPDSIVRYGGISVVDYYQYASFIITPFVYDATTGSLSFVSQVNISIELTDDNVTNAIFPTRDRVIKKIVQNPDDVNFFYPKSSQRSSVQNIDYLIITADSLKSSFEPLRIWKTQKGVYTKIVTTEEIDAVYSGSTQYLRIKQCVQDYYDNYGLKWLLLGGDNTIVPIVKAFSEYKTYDEDGNIKKHYKDSIPADIFYGCFTGAFDWNANGNNTIGELVDNVDFNQVVNISRLPIRTNGQVDIYVEKLLDYELNPSSDFSSLLLCAKVLDGYQNGISDAHIKTDYFVNRYISPYWNGNRARFYDTGTDFEGDANYQLNQSNLTTQLSNNYHFLHFVTHGSPTTWSIEGGSYYSGNVTALTNSNPMVVVTTACHTNAFDQAEPCLSEAFIRKQSGGSIVYLGSSRYGWFVPDFITLGPSFLFNGQFFYYLFTNTSRHFSEIVKLVKQHYKTYSTWKELYRWLILSNNAIGDAELPIYTTIPNKFENVTFERNGSSLIVNTGGVEGCTITISDIAEGGSYYATDTNTVSATFTDVPGSCTIVITKDNYIPYIIEPSCVITTEIIDDQRIITGCEETRIGGIEIIGTEIETRALGNGMQIPIDSSLIQSIRLGEVKITDIGSLEVINGGTVTIEHLSMEEGSELHIH
jgi:hypothetical protein